MKQCLIYGNCQASALMYILSNSSLSEEYNILFQKPVHVLTENEINSTVENFKKADLIIHQHVSKEYKIPELSTEYLLKFIKNTTKVISFPVCYFNAYFPMLDTFEGNKSILNQVHDFIIMGGYVKNIDSDILIHDIILNQELFSLDLSLAAYNFSISSLKKRQQFTDIVITDFIEKNYKDKKLFYQFNHPTNDLFQHIVKQIMNILGKDIVVNSINEILTDISTPIYPSTYRNLNLQFKNNYKYSTTLGLMDLNDVVQEFYKYYEKFDREYLYEYILKKKPFLWEKVIEKW